MSVFHQVEDLPLDPVFGIQRVFRNDTRKEKYNLTVGFYAEPDGTHHRVMDTVYEAESILLERRGVKRYLPITGDPDYTLHTGKFIFGDLYSPDSMVGIESVGGTSALRTGLEFLKGTLTNKIAISSPTWPNHRGIANQIGMEVVEYPYWDQNLDYDGMVKFLESLEEHCAVVLQPMSHNPTGIDLSFAQWEELSDLFKHKKLFPVFDTAYQGLGRGVDEDIEPVRMFVRKGHEMIVTHSFSKSMGLYNERVGACYIVLSSPALSDKVSRFAARICRTTYSNPPSHGAWTAKTILMDPKLKARWIEEVGVMRNRVKTMRTEFADRIAATTNTDHFAHVREGNGFFSLLGLSQGQVDQMREDSGVYLMRSSRINIAALTDKNLDPVVEAIAAVL